MKKWRIRVNTTTKLLRHARLRATLRAVYADFLPMLTPCRAAFSFTDADAPAHIAAMLNNRAGSLSASAGLPALLITMPCRLMIVY